MIELAGKGDGNSESDAGDAPRGEETEEKIAESKRLILKGILKARPAPQAGPAPPPAPAPFEEVPAPVAAPNPQKSAQDQLAAKAAMGAKPLLSPGLEARSVAKPAAPVKKGPTLKDSLNPFLRSLERSFPTLSRDLKRADMAVDPGEFLLQTIIIATAGTFVLFFVIYMLLRLLGMSPNFAFILMPVLFMVVFLWRMQFPRAKMKAKERDLDRDVLYAGRDMVISLRAGVPLFNAMISVSKNYGVASKEFSKIVTRIQSGVPAEVALQEASEANASQRFRQIIFQIIASLRSGSDVASALELVLAQISREQVISLKSYGQKLNPLTMFYLLFGIILPSIGITVGIILTSFVRINLDYRMLFVILLVLGFGQFMFLSIMKSIRPSIEV
ncbi:Type II secretion system (T2SS), protein F [uncultured archaeon]|nr:Type II secretion system (T2SS), protein F [uncultured archaeon]